MRAVLVEHDPNPPARERIRLNPAKHVAAWGRQEHPVWANPAQRRMLMVVKES
jgi:hypothetical protein